MRSNNNISALLITLVLCAGLSHQSHTECIQGLTSCIGDAVKVAEALKDRKLIHTIEDVSRFVNDYERKAKGFCKHLNLHDIHNVIRSSDLHHAVKDCLLQIDDTAIDARDLVHDFKHHKIISIVKKALQVKKDLGVIRGKCKHLNQFAEQ